MPRTSLVDRPHGTGDVLLMLFHDSCRIDQGEYPAWTLRCWQHGAGHVYGSLRPGPWRHSWVHMQGPLADRIADMLPEPHALDDPEPIQRHLRHLAQTAALDRDPELVAHAVRIVARSLQRLDSAHREMPAAWRELRLWIEQHAHQIEGIDQLAGRLGLARSQFHDRFIHHFDQPPMRYVQHLRLERARWLLRDHQRSVAAIAKEVGYADVAYFSRLVRKRFGVSPRGLRS